MASRPIPTWSRPPGSPKFTAIVNQVLRRVRMGRKIQLHTTATVPSGAKEGVFYAQQLERIRRQRAALETRKGIRYPEQLATLRAKARALTLSRELGEKLGGRRPMIYQMVAVAGLYYGWNSPEFVRIVTSMASTARNHPEEQTWEGNATGVSLTLKRTHTGQTLISHSKQIIETGPTNKAMESTTFMGKLGIPPTHQERTRLNAALQVLEIAGIVRKMPPKSQTAGHPISMWTLASRPNPPIDYPNTSIEILKALLEAPGHKLALTQIYAEEKRPGKQYGNPEGKYDADSIHQASAHLHAAGLLVLHRGRRRTRRISGSTHQNTITLTPEGASYVREMITTGHTPEGLRVLLLGERIVPAA